MFVDKVVSVLGPVIILLVYGLGAYLAFYVIKTAVKRGIREALSISESDLRRIVRRGVVDALDEHDSHESKVAAVPKPGSSAE
jgi:hypothetical protein